MKNNAYDYQPSRDHEDLNHREGDIIHADSRRRSNSPFHVSPWDNGVIDVGNDRIEVVLALDYDDDKLDTIGRWAKSASTGGPLKDDEPMLKDEARGILKGGLAFQSLEDIRIAFGVRGASRVLTHQLVRSRAAAFKQQSQRDCYYGALPEFRMPESVWMSPVIRQTWFDALRMAHAAYNMAVHSDIPYEDARYILPEGTVNFILCEYSLKEFLALYAYRGCVMFQSEMVAVMRAMRALLVEAHPYLEPHIKITCEKIHKCTFQGPEATANTCDFPWARSDTTTLDLQEIK
jgi:thymidylate synthase (FAD)